MSDGPGDGAPHQARAGHRHGHAGHHGMHGEDDPFLGEEGAAFWESWSPVLETGTATVTEAMLDAAGVGPGTRVLDLACGLGHATVAAARRGALATGLDLNPHMLAKALPGPTYVEGDMTRPPAGPWDAIVSRFGAHHADPVWVLAARDVLAPGGRLAIAEWHPETALFDVDLEAPMPSEDTADDWASRFEDAGLRDVTTAEVAFTIDFGDDAGFRRFLDEMDAESRVGAVDGKQDNRAYVVSGTR